MTTGLGPVKKTSKKKKKKKKKTYICIALLVMSVLIIESIIHKVLSYF